MVEGKMYYKIHEMKTMGFSNRSIARQLKINRETVGKYLTKTEDEYCRYRIEQSTRSRMLDRYRSIMEKFLDDYPDIPASVVYDKLLESDSTFEPSKRSVRLYMSELRNELGIWPASKIRQYEEVAELPAGQQAQVDMGFETMKKGALSCLNEVKQLKTPSKDVYGKKVKIYIFCMVMSHSRQKYVYFQLKPFTSEDFVFAHDLAFKYYGGRTKEIAYDQDRVLAVSENGGNILFTEHFEDYKSYAGFSVWLCRGYDPQSKGKIEAVVKFVKYGFLKYRTFCGIDSLNTWLDRTANGQKHDTTKKGALSCLNEVRQLKTPSKLVPKTVFSEERKSLLPVPALSKEVTAREAVVRSTNVIHYRQNRYQVPRGTYQPGRKARIDVKGDFIVFTDVKTGEVLAAHTLAVGVVGKLISLKTGRERSRGTKNDEARAKALAGFSGCPEAENYVAQILERFPRYNKEQLSILRKTQETYSAEELRNAVRYQTFCETLFALTFSGKPSNARKDLPL